MPGAARAFLNYINFNFCLRACITPARCALAPNPAYSHDVELGGAMLLNAILSTAIVRIPKKNKKQTEIWHLSHLHGPSRYDLPDFTFVSSIFLRFCSGSLAPRMPFCSTCLWASRRLSFMVGEGWYALCTNTNTSLLILQHLDYRGEIR